MSDELNEELDSQNQATEEVEKTEDVEETTTAVETEDVEKLKEQNKRLFERAKKAEAKLKEKPAETQSINSAPDTDPVAVATLANALQGLTQEEIDFAKTIAAGSKTSLLKALQTEGFQAYHKTIVAEERKKKAALGASHGSGQVETKSTSNMSREEHQKLAMEMAKNIQ